MHATGSRPRTPYLPLSAPKQRFMHPSSGNGCDRRLRLPQVGRADRGRIASLAYLQAICPAAARCGQRSDLVDGEMVALGPRGRRRRSAGRSLLHTHVELCAHKRARWYSDGAIPHTPVASPCVGCRSSALKNPLFQSGPVRDGGCWDRSDELVSRFREMRRVGEVARTRDGRLIARYVIYLVALRSRAVLHAAEER